MIEAATPANEISRQAAVDNLDLLDKPIEKRFERITRLLGMALNVPIVTFTLVDRDRLFIKSSQGLTMSECDRREAFCAHTILQDRPMVISDTFMDERFIDNPLVTGNPNIRFYAGCPVKAPDGSNVGALCAIDREARRLTPEQMQILRDLAGLIEDELRLDAIQKTNIALTEKLGAAENLALVDSLTRLWNRAGIMNIYKREWAESMRDKKPIGVVVADIDFFKKVNDTYGHTAGDSVLREIAKRFLDALRIEDAIGRMGGEEFLILLPGCGEDKLYQTMERIRTAISDRPIKTDGGTIPVTVSLGGISAVAAENLDMTDLIKQADGTLYEAKRGGRNCSRIAA